MMEEMIKSDIEDIIMELSVVTDDMVWEHTVYNGAFNVLSIWYCYQKKLLLMRIDLKVL
jgi:hypothetical protein